jgi:hypothetical protein
VSEDLRGVRVRHIGIPEYKENVASEIVKLRNAIFRQTNSVGATVELVEDRRQGIHPSVFGSSGYRGS